MKKTRVIGGVIVAAVALLLICRIMKKEEPVAPTPDPVVKVEKPITGDIQLTTDLVGTIEPADIAYIYPKAAGDIIAVNVKAGDTVEAGQVICEIDTKQVEASRLTMETAKVAWEDAESTLSRTAPLHASGYVSDKEFESYQNNTEALRLQYETAKVAYDYQMEFSHVTSPISGRVERCGVELHDTVAQTTQLAVISGDAGDNVCFYVTERIKNQLNLGDKITVTKEGRSCDGTVVEISSIAEPAVGLFKVKAAVNATEAMSAGTSVELTVPSASAKDAMLIPTNSISYTGSDPYVYTYDEETGCIHEIPVELGLSSQDYTVVLSGVNADDLILTTWTSELEEGTKVTLYSEETSAADSQAQ